MDAMEKQEHRVYHTKVDSSGRIVIPAEARQRNHIAEGDTVVVVEDGQGLHVKSFDQALADAQDYFATLAPADVLLSDSIIADRRSKRERD
jgi:AbrB family looped-hinge helix DNA binding protein